MKFGTSIKQIMMNMMAILFFVNFLTPVIFGQIWSQNKKCSDLNKIWHKYQTNHAEYDDDIIFYHFFDTCHFWTNLVQKWKVLIVLNEIWHKYRTSHAEYDGDIIFKLFITNLVCCITMEYLSWVDLFLLVFFTHIRK